MPATPAPKARTAVPQPTIGFDTLSVANPDYPHHTPVTVTGWFSGFDSAALEVRLVDYPNAGDAPNQPTISTNGATRTFTVAIPANTLADNRQYSLIVFMAGVASAAIELDSRP